MFSGPAQAGAVSEKSSRSVSPDTVSSTATGIGSGEIPSLSRKSAQR